MGENGAWDEFPQINTNSSSPSYQVTGLHPFTAYSFRVKAVNSLGESPPSIESYYTFTLREREYLNFLTNFGLTILLPTSIRLCICILKFVSKF